MIDQLKQSKAFYRSGQPPPKWPDFYQHITNYAKLDGLWLEFGTGVGATASNIIPHVPRRLYSFDWFKGLPESWTVSDTDTMPIGSFAVRESQDSSIETLISSLHKMHPKLTIVRGLFQDSLPVFLREHREKCAFIHIDCDLYSSTKTVLDLLGDRIVRGTVILFDELYGYAKYEQHEYRALVEFIERTGLGVEFIGHVADARQAGVVVV